MMDAPIDRGQTPESRNTFAGIDNVMWWLTVNLPTPPVGAPSILFKSMPCLLVSVRTAVGATVSQAGAAAGQEGGGSARTLLACTGTVITTVLGRSRSLRVSARVD